MSPSAQSLHFSFRGKAFTWALYGSPLPSSHQGLPVLAFPICMPAILSSCSLPGLSTCFSLQVSISKKCFWFLQLCCCSLAFFHSLLRLAVSDSSHDIIEFYLLTFLARLTVPSNSNMSVIKEHLVKDKMNKEWLPVLPALVGEVSRVSRWFCRIQSDQLQPRLLSGWAQWALGVRPEEAPVTHSQTTQGVGWELQSPPEWAWGDGLSCSRKRRIWQRNKLKSGSQGVSLCVWDHWVSSAAWSCQEQRPVWGAVGFHLTVI